MPAVDAPGPLLEPAPLPIVTLEDLGRTGTGAGGEAATADDDEPGGDDGSDEGAAPR